MQRQVMECMLNAGVQHRSVPTYLIRGFAQLSSYTPGKQGHHRHCILEALVCLFIEHLIFLPSNRSK